MDDLDRLLIRILQYDGRTSNAGIARSVGVSEGTVRRRLNRLVQEEYIQVVALPNHSKMGLESRALIGIQVDPGKIDEIADYLLELEEISWLTVTTGSFDIFAWTMQPSAEALGIFLRTKIGAIHGVHRTETFISLSDKKRGITPK